jgi:uncharacterized protein YbaP (TraB family)
MKASIMPAATADAISLRFDKMLDVWLSKSVSMSNRLIKGLEGILQ